ncbi:tenascin-R-like [Mercenaria mercenaria]|uniref:tenascin-R-like n=1 Tax=Mercenaria mercenaria TaxID=6596 RepID=UPI00234E4785|nr:tenascin-R-like [Mercenaria mercenaria]
MNAHPSFFYHKTAGLCKCHASIIDIDTDETADDKSQIYGFYLLGYQSLTFGSFKKWHVLPTQRDCLSLYHRGFVEDGVYLIYPINGTGVATWCDMTNGGWTVIQRRQDGQEDFYRTWDEYMAGFGNATGEYWLGLENIYTLTQSPSSLYIEMETFGDATPVSAYATYSSFTVHDVSANYTLYVDGFTGNCGDSLGTQFSTLDRDNDEASSKSCAVTYSGAWWYKSCHISNLNGLYLFGNFSSTSRGVVWRTCWGYNYSVKKVVMKTFKLESFKKWHIFPKQRDCLALYKNGFVEDGVYLIYPVIGIGVTTWCDMTNGGWTVIQRRLDGQEDFYRTWDEYVTGFGNETGEYWLGLESIHLLTQSPSSLYIEMESFGDITPTSAYAVYSSFTIAGGTTNYTMFVDGFTGNCGDSLIYHNGKQFTTIDRDNDDYHLNCAVLFSGAWWHNTCHTSNLNGLYFPEGNHSSFAKGINWYSCWGHDYSLKSTVVKIRQLA